MDLSFITTKEGPLPRWAWVLVGVGGYLVIKHFKGSGAANGSQGLIPFAGSNPIDTSGTSSNGPVIPTPTTNPPVPPVADRPPGVPTGPTAPNPTPTLPFNLPSGWNVVPGVTGHAGQPMVISGSQDVASFIGPIDAGVIQRMLNGGVDPDTYFRGLIPGQQPPVRTGPSVNASYPSSVLPQPYHQPQQQQGNPQYNGAPLVSTSGGAAGYGHF